MTMLTRTEFGGVGSAEGLRGLAAAAHLPLRDVVALAEKGELRTLFAGGKTFRHRSAAAPKRTPRQCLLELQRKRWEWAAP